MNYILLYIMITAFAVALKNISKFKIGRNINLSIILMTLIFLLICSYNIYFTRRVFFALFILAVVYIAFCLIKKKNCLGELREYIFTPSFILFTILYILFTWILRNAELTGIDDTFFWSQLVKNSLELGSLYPKASYLNVALSSYPPLYVGYLTMISSLLGGYKESFLLFGNAIFCVSFVVSIFDDVASKDKSITNIILSSLIVVLVLFTINWSPNLQHDTYLFNSIYVDWPIAVVFAYTFFRSFSRLESKQEIIYYTLSLITLSLIKQVGFPLAFLCLVTQLLRIFYLSSFKYKKAITITVVVIVILMAIVPSVQNSIYINFFNFIFNALSKYISTNVAIPWDERLTVVNTFIQSTLGYEIVMHPFSISYVYLVLLFTIIIGAIGFYKKSTSIKVASVMYLVGAIGYAIVICLFYVYCLSSSEAFNMVQFSRYMQVYTFAGIMIIVFILINEINTKISIIALAFCCLFIEPKSVMSLSQENLISIYHDPIEELKKYIDEDYDYERILVLNQNDPIVGAKIRSAFGLKGQNVAYTLYDEKAPLESFENIVINYDYLLIGGYNDAFYNTFWSKISNTELVNFALYRIVTTDDGIDFYFARSFAEEANKNHEN